MTIPVEVNPPEGSAVGREDSGLAPQPAFETSVREASRYQRDFLGGFLRGSLMSGMLTI